jgi:hypothetical protein
MQHCWMAGCYQPAQHAFQLDVPAGYTEVQVVKPHAPVTCAATQIEETMEGVRREMALLTEVDQPGSAIDQVRCAS